jgi:hypothetical protein
MNKHFCVQIFLSYALALFCLLLNSAIKANDSIYLLNDSCDSVTRKEFLSFSKKIYKRLDLIGRFSLEEKRQAIKIYNSIFLISSSDIRSRRYVKNFQQKFDRSYKKNYSWDSDEISTKNSAIIFNKLGVRLLNNLLINTAEYTCNEVFKIGR